MNSVNFYGVEAQAVIHSESNSIKEMLSDMAAVSDLKGAEASFIAEKHMLFTKAMIDLMVNAGATLNALSGYEAEALRIEA